MRLLISALARCAPHLTSQHSRLPHTLGGAVKGRSQDIDPIDTLVWPAPVCEITVRRPVRVRGARARTGGLSDTGSTSEASLSSEVAVACARCDSVPRYCTGQLCAHTAAGPHWQCGVVLRCTGVQAPDTSIATLADSRLEVSVLQGNGFRGASFSLPLGPVFASATPGREVRAGWRAWWLDLLRRRCAGSEAVMSLREPAPCIEIDGPGMYCTLSAMMY